MNVLSPSTRYWVLLLCLVTAPCRAQGNDRLGAGEAADHVGENATVCGEVVDTRYAERSRGQPTFLNLDRPYPDHVFTALIWGEYRPWFDNPPEEQYRGERVCVHGVISSYRGTPQIIVTHPSQISVQE